MKYIPPAIVLVFILCFACSHHKNKSIHKPITVQEFKKAKRSEKNKETPITEKVKVPKEAPKEEGCWPFC